jgi:hypothetical protein
MPLAITEQVNIPNISNDNYLQKAEVLLGSNFSINKIPISAGHIKLKVDIKKIGLSKPIHIEIFVNDNVIIKASPEIQAQFTALLEQIKSILSESINITSTRLNQSFRIIRAQMLLNYLNNLPLTDEVNRMLIVILCDIILDMVITEKLSSLTNDRAELESDSISTKLKSLEGRCKCTLYKSKNINDIRNLRNKIAHGAAPITEEEARNVLTCTKDVFAFF